MLARLLNAAKDTPPNAVEIQIDGNTSRGSPAVRKLIQDLRMRRIETFELRAGSKNMRVVVNYFGD